MGSYQLRDVPDVEGNLDEAPVAPGADVLAAVVVGVPQADQHLSGKHSRCSQKEQVLTPSRRNALTSRKSFGA